MKYFEIQLERLSHDTIGMITVDSNGNMAVGTSTNGATHKVPGLAHFAHICCIYSLSGIYKDNK